jgi:hypothetical protein
MITLIAAAALAAQAQSIAQPRQAFATCLSALVKKSVKEGMETAAFETALAAACKTEEAAFRKAVVDYDMKTGAKRATAEEGAQLQIDDYVANAKDSFIPPKE